MNNSEQKNVKKIRAVPKWANVLSIVITLIILAGIIESAFFFKLNLTEITIISVILFVFYLIILAILQKPRVIVLRRKMPEKIEENQKTERAVVESEEAELTLENAAPLKPKTEAEEKTGKPPKEIQEIKEAVSKTKLKKKTAKKKSAGKRKK